ncbi:hypothetical protein ACKLKM_23020, partial [Klebsiella pneumoniae]
LLCHGTVCVVGKMRDLILQLSKSSIYSTKPKMSLNNDPVYSVLTVGDQLLWGAAEPLRRMLNILLGKI